MLNVENPAVAQSSVDTWSKILAIIRDAVFIVAIYLYFTGFTYRYYYYDHFGLRNLISDPTPFNAFVLSYGVLAKHALVLVAVGVLFAAVFTAARRRRSRTQRMIAAVVAIVVAVAIFPVLNVYAYDKAHEDAVQDEQVAFHGKDARISIDGGNAAKYSSYFLEAAGGYDVHILARDERNTYVLWQVSSREGGGEVFVIPNSDIKYGEMYER